MATGSFASGDLVEISFRHHLNLTAGAYLLSFGCVGIEGDDIEVYDRRHDHLDFEVISDRDAMGVVDLNSAISLT